MSGTIAFVLKGYPRLSETFIAQEILALEQAGLDIEIVSLRKPTDASVHPVNREIKAPVRYLPEYLHQEPGRVWRAWRRVRKLPGYGAARRVFLRDLRRDLTRNRIRRWGQALVLAAELPPGTSRLHSHFIHTPASVTRYTSLMLGLELDMLGARQGHLDVAGVGAARETGLGRLGRHLHQVRLAAYVRPRPGCRPGASCLSRPGSVALRAQ